MKSSWQEPWEQFLHFAGLGVAGHTVLGPLFTVFVLVRELAWPEAWNLGIGQWPPGEEHQVELPHRTGKHRVFPADRVEDLKRDLVFTFAGGVPGLYIHFYWFQSWLWRIFS